MASFIFSLKRLCTYSVPECMISVTVTPFLNYASPACPPNTAWSLIFHMVVYSGQAKAYHLECYHFSGGTKALNNCMHPKITRELWIPGFPIFLAFRSTVSYPTQIKNARLSQAYLNLPLWYTHHQNSTNKTKMKIFTPNLFSFLSISWQTNLPVNYWTSLMPLHFINPYLAHYSTVTTFYLVLV